MKYDPYLYKAHIAGRTIEASSYGITIDELNKHLNYSDGRLALDSLARSIARTRAAYEMMKSQVDKLVREEGYEANWVFWDVLGETNRLIGALEKQEAALKEVGKLVRAELEREYAADMNGDTYKPDWSNPRIQDLAAREREDLRQEYITAETEREYFAEQTGCDEGDDYNGEDD